MVTGQARLRAPGRSFPTPQTLFAACIHHSMLVRARITSYFPLPLPCTAPVVPSSTSSTSSGWPFPSVLPIATLHACILRVQEQVGSKVCPGDSNLESKHTPCEHEGQTLLANACKPGRGHWLAVRGLAAPAGHTQLRGPLSPPAPPSRRRLCAACRRCRRSQCHSCHPSMPLDTPAQAADAQAVERGVACCNRL